MLAFLQKHEKFLGGPRQQPCLPQLKFATMQLLAISNCLELLFILLSVRCMSTDLDTHYRAIHTLDVGGVQNEAVKICITIFSNSDLGKISSSFTKQLPHCPRVTNSISTINFIKTCWAPLTS